MYELCCYIFHSNNSELASRRGSIQFPTTTALSPVADWRPPKRTFDPKLNLKLQLLQKANLSLNMSFPGRRLSSEFFLRRCRVGLSLVNFNLLWPICTCTVTNYMIFMRNGSSRDLKIFTNTTLSSPFHFPTLQDHTWVTDITISLQHVGLQYIWDINRMWEWIYWLAVACRPNRALKKHR